MCVCLTNSTALLITMETEMSIRRTIFDIAIPVAGLIAAFMLGRYTCGHSKPQLSATEIRIVLEDFKLNQPVVDLIVEKALELQKARREARGGD